MRSWKTFLAILAVSGAALTAFGLKRFALGIDFTDEGAYVSWPLRVLYGEAPFTSELMTMTRPVEVFLSVFFNFGPASTLYELRLAGWLIHVSSFGVLGAYLFRLGRSPVRCLLVAGIPLFVTPLHGIATPAYNMLSSDFLLIALSLAGLAAIADVGHKVMLSIGAGVALFLATLCHPGLGVVAAAGLAYGCVAQRLIQNLFRGKPTPANAGMLVFVACWMLFAAALIGSGAAGAWLERLPLIQSFSVPAVRENPLLFHYRLGSYLCTYGKWAAELSLGGVILITVTQFFLRTGKHRYATGAAVALAGLILAYLGYTVLHEPDLMTSAFALVAYLLLAVHLIGHPLPGLAMMPGMRPLLILSGLAGLIYAVTTFFFTPLRSWMSGALGLSFAFAVGLDLLLDIRPLQRRLARVGIALVLAFAVVRLARNHYATIYRDAGPSQLTATFALPKLRHIKSTPERTRSLDELYAYLRPKIAPGDPLLVFDDGPLLYYLFDAKPVYGLTWAIRYSQNPQVLDQLIREMHARPLPGYAIRLLVDPSYATWSTSARISYEKYPLNEMLMTHYVLAHTVFPFEIWQLK